MINSISWVEKRYFRDTQKGKELYLILRRAMVVQAERRLYRDGALSWV